MYSVILVPLLELSPDRNASWQWTQVSTSALPIGGWFIHWQVAYPSRGPFLMPFKWLQLVMKGVIDEISLPMEIHRLIILLQFYVCQYFHFKNHTSVCFKLASFSFLFFWRLRRLNSGPCTWHLSTTWATSSTLHHFLTTSFSDLSVYFQQVLLQFFKQIMN
jgi:hypothetical protein